MMDGGIARLKRLARDGHLSEIALPFDGTMAPSPPIRSSTAALFALTGWLTPADIWSVNAAGHVSATGLTPKPPIDVSSYESKRLFATARDGTKVPYVVIHKKGLKLDGSTPAWISAYGSYGVGGLHAGLCRPHARPGRCGLHRRLRLRARRRRVRPRLAQGRAACEQAQHLARPHRRVLRPVRQEIHRAGAACDRRPLGRRHHRRPRTRRAAGPVRRRHRRRRLVQSAALRGRAERLRRGTGVGQDQRGVRLPGAQGDRQLPGGAARCRLSGGAAHHRRHRPARRALPRGEDDGAAAGLHQFRQAHPAARRLRRRATASARRVRSRTARRPTPTRSCCGRRA